MRRSQIFNIPTCVNLGLAVSFAFLIVLGKTIPVWAANGSPNPDFPDLKNASPTETIPVGERQQLESSLDIANQPPVSLSAERRLGYFHKYHQALSLMIDDVIDTKVAADTPGSTLTRASLLYHFRDSSGRNSSGRDYEAGADLLSDGTGSISFERRWIYTQTRFRPYTKAGLGVRIDPRDQLTTFLKTENYQARAATGFEVLLRNPFSLRAEIEVTASLRSLQALAGLGFVWSW